MNEMRYPIGIQSFKKLHEGGYVYVDKTHHIHKLAHMGGYFFLSRPRRFGKSLLISTLEAYFLGQKELFKGLAIEQLETEWAEHPVLRLDLNTGNYETPEALSAVLNKALNGWESLYGKSDDETTPALRFLGVVERACKKTGRQAVVLVDEYDKPLLQSLDDEQLQDNFRRQLKAFYSVLKTQDQYIRFALLTGVTRFSKVSVFSDLNNLIDISIDDRFADICGITDAEIDRYFPTSIAELAEGNGMTYEEARQALRQQYDGYHFDIGAPGVYNPFSLLNALGSRKLNDYWFASGTPTFLVELLKQNDYDLERLRCEVVSEAALANVDSYRDDPVPMLYQSGYLTIKGGDPRFRIYTLGFPNQEVERGFADFLLPYYAPVKRSMTSLALMNLVTDVERGKPEAFMQRLTAFYANTNYKIVGEMEKYFHNSLFLIFTLMGIYTEAEHNTSRGCIDLVLKTKDFIYVIECKLDRSAGEALQQINDRGYAVPYTTDPRKLYKIGVNFSSATRGVEGYVIE